MTDDRLWWQKRLTITDGVVVTVSQPGWVAKALADSHRVGTRSAQSAVSEFQCHGSSSPMEDVAACLIYAYMAAQNPGLSDRELLGLPKDEPAPAKPMTKAEIAARLRKLAEDVRGVGAGIFLDLAAAVEALPEPDTRPIGPRVAEFAGKLTNLFEESRCGTPHLLTTRLAQLVADVEKLPEPEAVKVSPFARRVRVNRELQSGLDALETPQLAVSEILSDIGVLIEGAFEVLGGGSLESRNEFCDLLVDLSVTCQRAAEDLSLIAKQ